MSSGMGTAHITCEYCACQRYSVRMPLRVAALRCLGVQNRWLAKPPSWLPRPAMWLPAIVDATQLRASVRGTGISDLGRSCSDEPSGGPASATTVTRCMSACDAAGPVSSQASRDWQKVRFASPRSISSTQCRAWVRPVLQPSCVAAHRVARQPPAARRPLREGLWRQARYAPSA